MAPLSSSPPSQENINPNSKPRNSHVLNPNSNPTHSHRLNNISKDALNSGSNPNSKETSTIVLPRSKNSSHKNHRSSRSRAIRMSRENQIPSLAIRCAASQPTSSNVKGTLHSLFEKELEFQKSLSCEPSPNNNEITTRDKNCNSTNGAIVVYTSKTEVSQTFSDAGCGSGGEGDVSDVGTDRGAPDLFELRNWRGHGRRDSSSSTVSLSELSSGGDDNEIDVLFSGIRDRNHISLKGHRIHSSLDDNDDWLSEDWKLQAEVLAAECNLIRVENELSQRKWKHEKPEPYDILNLPGRFSLCMNETKGVNPFVEDEWYSSSLENHAEERLYEIIARISDMQTKSGEFAKKASKRLQDDSRKRLRGSQNTIHLPQDGHGNNKNEGTMNTTRNTNKRCSFELPLGFSGTQDATEFIRREYRSMLSRETDIPSPTHSDQMLAEELTYKAAIRQIVEQMQGEIEQWSQVQEILRNLQDEMKSLNEARDIWEERALRAEAQLLSLKETVHDWRSRAQNAEEKVAQLESKKQRLKRKIQNMKQRHATERNKWLEGEANRTKDSSSLPTPDVQPNAVVEIEEKPRPANVGTQEDYALCESIVHSRNESTRSSLDLGAMSQRSFATTRSSKKSLDFSTSSYDGTLSRVRIRNHRLSDQLLKIEPTKLDFCSKSSDVNKRAKQKSSNRSPRVELAKLEVIEPVCGNDSKDLKLLSNKENIDSNGKPEGQQVFSSEAQTEDELVSQTVGQEISNQLISLKSMSKSALSSGPNLRPVRVPFGEIMNSSMSCVLNNDSR